MIFTTWTFFVFMAVVFIAYWWLVPSRWRREFLLAASLAYFTYSYPPHTLLLLALVLVTYLCGAAIHRAREKGDPGAGARRALLLGLCVSVGALAFFKYSKMGAATLNWMLSLADMDPLVKAPNLIIPLGISFFTFEFVHYLTDLYLGKIGKTSLREYALFAFFFPGLASGPVKRFQIFQQQGEDIQGFRVGYLDSGLRRILFGIFKKVVVADSASQLTTALADPSGAGRAMLWVAMYAYAVKIYYDFSGYSDIAIGCSQLLGYRLPENFNRPYREPNISRFWNHWHMSLSSWIRDYLFIPLGGSRRGTLRTLLNLTLVMAICGLWHGANWNFIVWGLWHGAGLAALRLYRPIGERMPSTRWVHWLSVFVTFHFVCVGWVLFASPDLPAALHSLRVMFWR
jgi:alginate O-acetyltransferase complex protein AlgI